MLESTPLQVLKSQFFRALAHPTRIRLLERLADGERTVQELQAALALAQPIVSQHLAALRAKDIVTVRRSGAQAYYATRPAISQLLRVARDFLNQHLSDNQSMLRELQRERRRGAARP